MEKGSLLRKGVDLLVNEDLADKVSYMVRPESAPPPRNCPWKVLKSVISSQNDYQVALDKFVETQTLNRSS